MLSISVSSGALRFMSVFYCGGRCPFIVDAVLRLRLRLCMLFCVLAVSLSGGVWCEGGVLVEALLTGGLIFQKFRDLGCIHCHFSSYILFVFCRHCVWLASEPTNIGLILSAFCLRLLLYNRGILYFL